MFISVTHIVWKVGWIGKDVEGSGLGLIWGTILSCICRDLWIPQKTLVIYSLSQDLNSEPTKYKA